MNIEIRIAENDEAEKWDSIIAASSYGTIFHTWKWLKIIENHSKYELYPIIAFRGTEEVGIYPLFFQKGNLFKSVFSPPPKVGVPNLGPVIADYDKLKQNKKESIFIEFQKKIDEFLEIELKPNYIYLSTGLPDARPFKWAGYHVEPEYNYITKLNTGKDHIWNGFERNLRQNISRAEKRGIHVEEGSKEELEWIYDAITNRYLEQERMISISKKYLLDLYESFYPKNMKIFIAKHKGEFVGGMVDIYYGERVVSWLGNIKANVNGVSPNDLLQWKGIEHAIINGSKSYMEIGANTERLCHYKSKYNPTLSICFTAKKHSSIISKFVETTYFKVLKPLNIWLNLSRKE